jgi:hypothetical protein
MWASGLVHRVDSDDRECYTLEGGTTSQLIARWPCESGRAISRWPLLMSSPAVDERWQSWYLYLPPCCEPPMCHQHQKMEQRIHAVRVIGPLLPLREAKPCGVPTDTTAIRPSLSLNWSVVLSSCTHRLNKSSGTPLSVLRQPALKPCAPDCRRQTPSRLLRSFQIHPLA